MELRALYLEKNEIIEFKYVHIHFIILIIIKFTLGVMF